MSDLKLTASEMAEQREVTSKATLGFWIYLMTDCILFATLFATFAILRNNTFGGPSGRELFDLPYAGIETIILLTSSFTCGLAILAARQGKQRDTLILFGITFVLGLSFLGLEIGEFRQMVLDGNSWRRSGFLSSFFTLVATHGLHITVGLLWMMSLMVQTMRRGLHEVQVRRLTMLSMFWHFLDVIWIFIFTIVYLMGVI